ARAAEIIVGCELLLQLGVFDVVEIGGELLLHRLALWPGFETPLVELVDELPPALLALITARQSQLQTLAPARVRILTDMDPLRAADELGDVAPGPGEPLRDLHATGAAADDPPALAGIGHSVIPARRVKGRAGEIRGSRNVRKERLVEKSGGADEDIRNVGVALCGLDVPATGSGPRCDDLLVEAGEFCDAAVARVLLDVAPDLGARGIFAEPVIVGLERKFILAR